VETTNHPSSSTTEASPRTAVSRAGAQGNLKLRGFAKDTVLYGLGDFGGKAAALILVPIVSRIFSPATYGVIDLLNVSSMFISTVIGLNLDSGLQKFFYLVRDEQRKVLLTSTVVFQFAVTSSIAVLLVVLSRPISLLAFGTVDCGLLIALYAASLPIGALLEILMLLLRLNRRAIGFSAYNLARVVLLPVSTYICVVKLKMGVNGVAVAMVATSGALTLATAFRQRSEFARRIRMRPVLELARFCLPGLPAVVATNVLNLLPRYFLGIFAGLSAVGIYAIADKIAKVVDMIKTAFNRAWNPFAFSNAGKPDEKYLYENIFKFFTFGLVLVSLALGVFGRQVLWILTPPQYHGAEVYIAGLCLFYSIRAMTLIFATGLYTSNQVIHTSYLEGVQLAAFVLSAFALARPFGAMGAVLALDVSAIVYFLCYAFTTKRYFPFRTSVWRLLAVFSLGLGLWIASRAYRPANPIGAAPVAVAVAVVLIFSIAGVALLLNRKQRAGLLQRWFIVRGRSTKAGSTAGAAKAG